jgi:hypothetical protein
LSKVSGTARAGIRVSKWNFTPVRHKVSLFATDINQVLKIGPDGVTREVNNAFPKGTSSIAWFRRMINDGRFIRELKGSPLPNLGIACERNGVFTGFSIARNSRYILWSVELPR